MSSDPDGAVRWFSRVVWLGIVANLALAVPTLFAPDRLLEMSHLPVTVPIMWTQFSALLLILLSAFYVPAALDPLRYTLVAWLSVFARLAGVIFFVLFQAREYHLLGYFDLVFFVPEAVLLFIATRSASAGGASPRAAVTSSRRL
jgi:hypothetical protein